MYFLSQFSVTFFDNLYHSKKNSKWKKTYIHQNYSITRIFSNFNKQVLLLHSPVMGKQAKYSASDRNKGT
jgi:hypothetical protein